MEVAKELRGAVALRSVEVGSRHLDVSGGQQVVLRRGERREAAAPWNGGWGSDWGRGRSQARHR